ncbi:subtilisin-like protein [Decorospora gaudefroyi]|uniref:Subtilisin-like protein n=1 Tax=Decorospora gaudefroyi TaxID=184978 RepID=A0A6A5K0J9_9PLEO|nr:subtilisin-like protein [Decorospora gaudefroyi]
MKAFFATAAGLLAAGSTVLAAASPKGDGYISKFTLPANHTTETEEYIITFWRNETIPRQIDEYLDMMSLNKDDALKFESVGDNPKVFIVEMCEEHVKPWMALTEVNVVERKAMVKSYAQQNGSPWGLQRVSSAAGAFGDATAQDFTYSFDDERLGAGVDIYVIDTGVRTSHAVFTGRATQGFTATGSFVDGDGHGTHVAGTAGGAKFGVAQGANIIEVKVLGDDGSGASSDTIRGMDWVIANHNKRKNEPGFVGSIMSMSWGLEGTAQSVDEVVAGASEAGIHVSVAAGNEGVDACGNTPAHLGGASSNIVTVGSVNIDNAISRFSNVGRCVDIYAPGEDILSAWAEGDNVIKFLSGTSMATPHTTGVMAYLMTQDVAGLGQNPAALKAKLLQTAREGQIRGNTAGSANLLLSNGVDGSVAKRLTKNYVVPEHSGLNGSPAARASAIMAKDLTLDKRFKLHSRETELRF